MHTKTLSTMLVVILTPILSFGQETTIRVTRMVASGRSVPDPKSLTQCFVLIDDDSFAKEMQLSDVQKANVREMVKRSNGNPGVVVVSRNEIGNASTPEEFAAIRDGILSQREAEMTALLDIKQRERLRQLVYWEEVDNIGYKNALINGFLGEDAGLTNSEKDAIEIASVAIERDARAMITRCEKKLRDELLRILTPHQQKQLPQLLGQPFDFDGVDRSMIRRAMDSQVEKKFVQLLRSPEIREELRIGEREENSLLERIRSASPPKNWESVISSNQMGRLFEIGYQFEIEQHGFAKSLIEGQLGEKLEITSQQRLDISRKLNQFSKEFSQIDDAIRQKYLQKVTRKSSSNVNSLLGDYFSKKFISQDQFSASISIR